MLTEAGPKGLRVAAANSAAQAQSVVAGLGFVDARARIGGLRAEPVDRAADEKALMALARWMGRWSPLVATDGLDGLILELTGCARLFGGEDRILAQIGEALSGAGVTARLGLADTIGAAWAVSRMGEAATILPPGAQKAALAPLPVAGLRLSEAALTLLRRFGLVTIGALYGIDRKALARRFRSAALADQVHLRLDQALGRRAEPIHPLVPPPDYSVRLPCPEPLLCTEGVAAGLSRLVDDLCTQLRRHGQGARSLCLSAYRSDGGVSSAAISLARPARDAAHIGRLFRERIDRIDPGFGIDLLVLSAQRTSGMATVSQALMSDAAGPCVDLDALGALADRLAVRLGNGVVQTATPIDRHLPEGAEKWSIFEGELEQWTDRTEVARPLFLFDPPEPVDVIAEAPDGPPQRFVWRGLARRIVRADGPERIAPEWWCHLAPQTASTPQELRQNWLSPKMDPRADAAQIVQVRALLNRRLADMSRGRPVRNTPRTRDYYRVEDSDGRRLWMYREGDYGDAIHGAPQWNVHGLFS